VDIAPTIATIFEDTHPNTDGRFLDEIFVDGKEEVQNDFIPIHEKNEGQSPFHKIVNEKNSILFQKHIFLFQFTGSRESRWLFCVYRNPHRKCLPWRIFSYNFINRVKLPASFPF